MSDTAGLSEELQRSVDGFKWAKGEITSLSKDSLQRNSIGVQAKNHILWVNASNT
jgi:hypothetical protein